MSTPQAMAALQRANHIRLARTALRAEVRELGYLEGRAVVADIIEEAPECCRSMTVVALLQWVKRLGPGHAGRIVGSAGVSEFATVDRLTDRQTEALRACLVPGRARAAA